MGIIRLLLALAVVGAHSNSHPLLKFVGGEVAVQAFFVISGFYMAMIVDSYKTTTDFWVSRYLRLYPIYIFCAILTLLLVQGFGNYVERIEKLPTSAILFLTLTNITIFFQDITMFLGVNNDTLSFVKNFGESTPPLYQLLLIPQGWSLGTELSFYLIAPFLLKRGIRTLVVVMFFSELLRIILIGSCCSNDPWSYRFFPTELSTFLLGSLAYKFYDFNKIKIQSSSYSEIGFSFLLLFLLAFTFLPTDYQTKKIIFILCLVFLIGNIFYITKDSKLDNFIGMLSYPIYTCHLLVIGYFLPKLHIPSPDGRFSTTLLAYAVVIGFSIFLYLLIEKPVDSFRQRFKRKVNAT